MLSEQNFKLIFFGPILLLWLEMARSKALLISSTRTVRQHSTLVTKPFNQSNENNSTLTPQQDIKLKEIRKFARLAGHDAPENITNPDPNICYKDDCLKAAMEFFISMDLSEDPCKNWKKFACEWRTLSSKTSTNHLMALALKVKKQVKGILADTTSEKKSLQLAQSYYRSCLAWSQDIKSIDYIVNYLNKIGNWPLLSAKKEEGEWLPVLSEIYRVAPLNVEPILLKIQPSESSNEEMVIQIDSGSTNLISDMDDMKDLLKILRKKPPLSVEAENQDLVAMQKSLRMLAESSFNTGESKRSKIMSLQDLQTKIDKDIPKLTINILRLVEATFDRTDFKVTPTIDVLVDYDSLITYLNVLQSHTLPVYNAIFLQLALILVGDLTTILEENNYIQLENYKRPKPIHYCQDETTEMFQYALSKEYILRYPSTLKSRAKVKDMFDSLKNGFLDVIGSISWLGEQSLLKAEIRNVELLNVAPDWIKDDLQIESYYSSLTFDKNVNGATAYLNNRVTTLAWLNGKDWKMKFDRIAVNGWNINTMSGFIGNTDVEYISEFNQIRIPAGVLQPPMFSEDFPGYMNFGALGIVTGRELSRIFINKASEASVANNFLQNYEQWILRIQNVWQEDSDMSIKDKVLNILPYHITFNGYERYLKALKNFTKEEVKLPGLSNLSPMKLFHLKYTNVLCESSVIKSWKSELNKNPENSIGFYPLVKSKNFATLFGCELD